MTFRKSQGIDQPTASFLWKQQHNVVPSPVPCEPLATAGAALVSLEEFALFGAEER